MLVVLLVVVWPGPHASQADKLGGGLRALMLVAYAIVTTLGKPFVARYKLGAAVLHAALLSSFAGGVVLLARRAKADESELRAGETSRRDDDVRLREAHRALERAKDEAAAQQAEAERIARERQRGSRSLRQPCKLRAGGSSPSPRAADRLERTPPARGLVRAAYRTYSDRVADVKCPSLTSAWHLLPLRPARGGARTCSARVTS